MNESLKKSYTISMLRARGLPILVMLGMLLPASASAATLYLDPSSGTYGPGDTFEVNVRLNTDDSQCINAAHVEIDYPTATLRAVDFGRGDSIFSLWIADPQINTDTGTIQFSGGVPGGYCGRIPGDPAISNILGKIVFTVVGSSTKTATVHFSPSSELYANDGLGTKVVPALTGATFSIAAATTLSTNPWIDEVSSDTIAPEPFDIQVESTRGVFNGKYYIVFSTVDKQSGLDHFEIFENGAWNRITSPYQLRDQSLKGGIQVRAIDKAGNVRLGTYTEGSAPPRQYSFDDLWPLLFAFSVLLLGLGLRIYTHRKEHRDDIVDLRT